MEHRKLSRRQFIQKLTGISSILFLFSSFSYLYARYFEPSQIQVTNHTITSHKIPKSFQHTRIIQFSDTHLGHNYNLDQLSKLVDKINKLKPNMILFTGDLMDAPNKYPYKEKIIPILKRLDAPLGKYAIYGNHDHGGYGSNDYKKIMEAADFKLLVNETIEIQNSQDESITLSGLDDLILGHPDAEKTFKNVSNDKFSILMVHEPDVADTLVNFSISIQLSGHSHGGQVQIPFYGPLITPPGATHYHEGFYQIHEDMQLYVNRGIGTTRLPFRFLSYPELTVFTLQKK